MKITTMKQLESIENVAWEAYDLAEAIIDEASHFRKSLDRSFMEIREYGETELDLFTVLEDLNRLNSLIKETAKANDEGLSHVRTMGSF